jgi:hypothetical protein
MLTPSADRGTIGLAENNISSGPVLAYDVAAGNVAASAETEWFTFEVAVNRNGSQLVVPTYNGAYVYNRVGSSLALQTRLGQYASHGPIAAVYSPVADALFTAEWDFGRDRAGIKMYDTRTWQQAATLDTYNFPWSGNGSMGQGRIEISPDGRWLAASVDNGVRLYSVSIPEPGSLVLGLTAAVVGWAARRRRR